MRGDRTPEVFEQFDDEGSPPRARGPPAVRAGPVRRDGITPACAGTAGNCSRTRLWTGDHPRVRGDRYIVVAAPDPTTGSPPRARGPRNAGRRRCAGRGITPACAGTAVRQLVHRAPIRDHPRVRGDRANARQQAKPREGSPPRARGPYGPAEAICSWSGITPACAGTARWRCRRWRPGWDHPRVRGDRPDVHLHRFRHWGSPPRARGPLVPRFPRARLDGITPACAGTALIDLGC